MALEGEFPKRDGDVLYASEVNKFAYIDVISGATTVTSEVMVRPPLYTIIGSSVFAGSYLNIHSIYVEGSIITSGTGGFTPTALALMPLYSHNDGGISHPGSIVYPYMSFNIATFSTIKFSGTFPINISRNPNTSSGLLYHTVGAVSWGPGGSLWVTYLAAKAYSTRYNI